MIEKALIFASMAKLLLFQQKLTALGSYQL